MKFFKQSAISCILLTCLTACGGAESDLGATNPETKSQTSDQAAKSDRASFETLSWEDLMPEGEEKLLAELYTEFYEEQERAFRSQMTLAQAAKEDLDIMSMIDEGSAQDTMEQIGTFNVVEDLDGAKIRLPGYVVPLDFNAASEYDEFLLVPYFGACLHTPPPPPNQIVFIKSETPTKIANIYDPVWVEGTMKTGEFGSELGNSAYELTLANLEPYEY